MTSTALYNSGVFAGVSTEDAFAMTATQESPVVVTLPAITWPDTLKPVTQSLGSYTPGEKITAAVTAPADVLILLYTELEISALLEVFTQNNTWTPARKQTWYPYAHNFANFQSSIACLNYNDALKNGIFGFLYAMKIGNKNVVLYKSELHPKQNGSALPFIPVIKQLVGELAPKLVISTGTAGAIGSRLNCGDVAITTAARFHCQQTYPSFPAIDEMSRQNTALSSAFTLPDGQYLRYAAQHFTQLSLPGLAQCYNNIHSRPECAFLRQNTQPPAIFMTNVNPVPGPQPMDVVSADFLTVDDTDNSEGLQALGIMNETDDAFAFYAISQLPAAQQPAWVSVRNASEPQIDAGSIPAGTPASQIIKTVKATAGSIYGVYQYCTTINSAFACWGVVAGL